MTTPVDPPDGLRVLHVLDHSAPLHSGYAFRTLALLREQRRMGWQTFALTGPRQGAGEGLEEDVGAQRFHRTPAAATAHALPGLEPALDVRRIERRLLEVAAEVRPHVLHAHSPVLGALAALRVGRRMDIPVVYEVRAFWEDAAVDHGSTTEGSLRYRLTRALETHALRRADHVFTICEGLRAEIVGRGIPARKVSVVPNAVDIDRFAPGGAADEGLQARMGLAGATVLGFIGSFYAYEGLDLLVDALGLLLPTRPDLRVLLVGGGPQEPALQARVAAQGLEGKVVFAGRVPHAEVARWYDLVDVLVYPRRSMRLTELVTPLKPLEAMAQGRLVLASDVGGHRELIRDGLTGRLFPAGQPQALAQAVEGLLAAREAWPHMRRAARGFVELERHWSASAAHYRPVFEALAGARVA